MKISATLAAILLTAGPSVAGGLGAPEGEPAVTPASAPVAASDWTGAYAGVQIANLDGDINRTGTTGSSLPFEFSDAVYGVHAGYDHDFGQFVLGGEIEYNAGDVQIDVVGIGDSGVNVDSLLLLKLRGGFDLGNAMVYATTGLAQIATSVDDPGLSGTPPGDADGYFGGLGAAVRASDRIIIGGEILWHEFDGFDDDPNFEPSATTMNLRLSYKF